MKHPESTRSTGIKFNGLDYGTIGKDENKIISLADIATKKFL
jgi:hypothetical protein